MRELGRVEIETGATEGYLLANGERQPLPVGSSLKDGVFYWGLGPGFLGEYTLVFTRAGAPDVRATVRVKAMR